MPGARPLRLLGDGDRRRGPEDRKSRQTAAASSPASPSEERSTLFHPDRQEARETRLRMLDEWLRLLCSRPLSRPWPQTLTLARESTQETGVPQRLSASWSRAHCAAGRGLLAALIHLRRASATSLLRQSYQAHDYTQQQPVNTPGSNRHTRVCYLENWFQTGCQVLRDEH